MKEVRDKLGNILKMGQFLFWPATQSIVRVTSVGEAEVGGKKLPVIKLELEVAMTQAPVLADFIVVQTPQEATKVDAVIERATASIPVRPELVRPQ